MQSSGTLPHSQDANKFGTERVQRELNEKRAELLAREAQLREIEKRMMREQEEENRKNGVIGATSIKSYHQIPGYI